MRLVLLLSGFLLLAGCSDDTTNQGFAGLAEPADASAYLQPRPGDTLVFPEDYGPHTQHRIEWWYLTANLKTGDGKPVGLQWTQFRQAIQPRSPEIPSPEPSSWTLDAAWMAHAAISLGGEHRFAEKLARGDVGHAGAEPEPLRVWLDNWQLRQQKPGVWHLSVHAREWGYDLTLTINGDPVAHGDRGFSAKSASGEGSMYFSLVDIALEGQLTLGEQIVPVSGKGWFDREWSSQLLKTGQQGWDWFALHLDSGDKLMAFQLREEEGGFKSGTWLPADGEPVPLSPDALELKPEEFRHGHPVRWRLQVPGYGVDVSVKARPGNYLNMGQFPYWESPVDVDGSHSGVGYMELTGYARDGAKD
ncbi:lipocalin-like domain-containing protein [Marinobacter sp. chi1]|uniref:Lipocalin-like domain-containing protein n=1 Tax=Marinobacter suaedae TaxID=3057675 RepID=A0ABT8VZZ2_9GAMM|nr:lipocalin-like domain-containing protein [Marinobacter sp. chi1]MDO3721569.1 lipocalin-like domain-containing protein [Marinobacter sp. chi1]